ncbi:hypothetical protein ACOSP7_009135 [Xanthoceras sorbifolium]
MSALPVDLIVDMFLQLPVKSLLLLGCLSKQFCSMIEVLDFSRCHFNTSLETNSNWSLIVNCDIHKPDPLIIVSTSL